MIKKIDDDHYEVATKTTVIYCLSELQQELENLQKMNEEIQEFNAWRETLPENRKEFIEEKYTIPTDEVEAKIIKIQQWQEA